MCAVSGDVSALETILSKSSENGTRELHEPAHAVNVVKVGCWRGGNELRAGRIEKKPW